MQTICGWGKDSPVMTPSAAATAGLCGPDMDAALPPPGAGGCAGDGAGSRDPCCGLCGAASGRTLPFDAARGGGIGQGEGLVLCAAAEPVTCWPLCPFASSLDAGAATAAAGLGSAVGADCGSAGYAASGCDRGSFG